MSSIPYSGGVIVDTTFAGSSRSAIATAVIAQLINAGWASISGSGTDQVLQCARTAQGTNSISMRVYDPGSGTCAQVFLRSAAGDKISSAFYLVPGASTTYRIIACKHNFFILVEGSTASRQFLCGGTVAVPSFLDGVITGDLGFLQGNGQTDTDTTVRQSFRTVFHAGISGSNKGAALVNGNLLDYSGYSSAQPGYLQLLAKQPTCGSFATGYRWYDATLRAMEAEIGWGPTAVTDEGRSIGFLHNCMLLSDTYVGDDRSITSYDGHAWCSITNNYLSLPFRGTLFVAIS